jgi:glycosyltransferase involved in cell wall biosynthesis
VGIHREISENHAGVVVPCEISAIAAALREVLSRPDFRSGLAANAGRLSLSRFSRSSILDALLAAYRRVLEPEPV